MAANVNQGPISGVGPLRITFKGFITALDKKPLANTITFFMFEALEKNQGIS
jgi:hypothetical protein